MADGRKNNGGARKGAGRKPKSYEVDLSLMMDGVLDPEVVLKSLKDAVIDGDVSAIKTWMSYRFGQPKQSVDLTSKGESINTLTPEQAREKAKKLREDY